MKTNSFSFDLPEHLIAQKPTQRREDARLMVSDKADVSHRFVRELADIVPANAVLVVNDSRVRKARIYAKRAGVTAERDVEFLFLEAISQTRWKVLARRPGRNPDQRRYVLPGEIDARLVPDGEEFILEARQALGEDYFERYGHVPLPPYIERADETIDATRYQTVYARNFGSAAAPTAGLHLTEELLDRLTQKGVRVTQVTLHVGTGTFAPVRTEKIEDHRMHTEQYEVSDETAEIVNSAKAQGRPVVAVGTTCVRTLESAWQDGTVHPGRAESDLFIYPGYHFNVIDELLTNFHTPRSSLLMLVSAFAGTEHVRELYRLAVEREYRFFSYGDAMYLRP
ncbi:MAG: tRNA preQ1(34) S-adenosylmethionine ribosyltransferase-isomerase QueA [Spirochaetia bacterium]